MNELAAAFAELNNEEGELRKRHFPVGQRSFIQRKKDAMKRKDQARARSLIKAKNCLPILEALPRPGDILHGITSGDFVMGDIISQIVERHGPPTRVSITTLSMSVKNAEVIAEVLKAHPELEFELLVSNYFKSTNGEVYIAIEELLQNPFPEQFRLGVGNTHSKILLFDYPSDSWVIETSANLRSCKKIEQFTISNHPELLKFHRKWMLELFALIEKTDE